MKHQNGMKETIHFDRGTEKQQHHENIGWRESFRWSTREFKHFGTSQVLIRKAAKACLRSLRNTGINASMTKILTAQGFGGYKVEHHSKNSRSYAHHFYV